MKLNTILNIMPDEKFLDYYIEMSEKFIPGTSSYIVFSEQSNLKFIRKQNDNLLILPKNETSFEFILKNLPPLGVVVFHGFQVDMLPLISSIPPAFKKVWLFWGYEGYDAITKVKFLGFHSDYAMRKRSLFTLLKFSGSRIKQSFLSSYNFQTRDIIRQMDYCATWIDADFSLAQKYHYGIKRLDFTYYTKELMHFEGISIQKGNRDKIFLGNSAAATNNHIEALRFLKGIKFEGEIVCPLSYAGTDIYTENVCRVGHKLFGERFIPLKDFIPLMEYQEIVNNCGVVWMNHKRQQAAGNLLLSFLAFKVVITGDDNPMNSTLKKWGLTFFNRSVLTELGRVSDIDLEQNRQIILERLTMEQNKPFFEAINSM